MTEYLKVQDPFDKKRKVKALRPTVKMGGEVTRNGKPVSKSFMEKSQREHEKRKALYLKKTLEGMKK